MAGPNLSISFFGRGLGYLFSYLIFTTLLYYVMVLSDKLPAAWNYLNLAALTLCIVFTGILLKWFLR